MKRTFSLLLLALLSSFVWAQNITVLLNENFESGTDNTSVVIPGWYNIATEGTRLFRWRRFDTNMYAQATAYNSPEPSNVMWLITPPIQCGDSTILTFRNAYGFKTHEPDEVLVSTDFVSDPTAATWTALSYTKPDWSQQHNNYTPLTPSGDVSLKQWANQTIYIAFKYTGNAQAGLTTTWQVDDILVKRVDVAGNLELSSKKVTLYPNPVSDYLVVNTFETGKVTIYNALGMKMLETTDLTIDVRKLQSGLYLLQFENGTRKETIKFYKK